MTPLALDFGIQNIQLPGENVATVSVFSVPGQELGRCLGQETLVRATLSINRHRVDSFTGGTKYNAEVWLAARLNSWRAAHGMPHERCHECRRVIGSGHLGKHCFLCG